MIMNLTVLLVLAIAVALFAVANSSAVIINLILWQSQQVSLAIVILVSVLSGFIAAGVIAVLQKIRDGLKIKQLESKIKELERYISQRGLPLQ